MATKALILRADASVAMGTGHVMRCLALAQAWRDAGGHVVFAMADASSSLRDRLQAEDIQIALVEIPAGSHADAQSVVQLARTMGAGWVVVDGYQFNSDYQSALKSAGLQVLLVDDNGDAGHYSADLILNQNAHAIQSFYDDREPYTRLLLGPRYAMLRREFAEWREWKREIAPFGSKVLVTMGGSDPENVTGLVIEALQLVRMKRLEAVVVVGGSNPHLGSLKQLIGRCEIKITLERNVSNMPALMAWADVAVSAAGTTCWEMCLLGLPALLLSLVENQRPIALELQRSRRAIYLGESFDATAAEVAVKLRWLLASSETRAAYSQRGHELVDGRGSSRVTSAIQGAADVPYNHSRLTGER